MRIFFYILFLTVSLTSFSQLNWERSIGAWGTERGYAVKQTLDTGFVIVGSSTSFYHQNQCYVVKLNKYGEIVWTNHYGGEGLETAYDVDYATDSGLAVAGITNSFSSGYDMYFAKLNKLGDTIFTKTYGGTDWDFAYALTMLPDSSYVLAGETYSYGAGSNDAYLVKINMQGDTVWTKTFGGSGDEMFSNIILTQNGEIVAVGTTNSSGAGEKDVYLVRVDQSGNLIYEHAIGTAEDDLASEVVELNSGELLIAGKKFNGTDFDGWLFKTNAVGVILDQVGWLNYTAGVYDQSVDGLAKYKNRDSVAAGVNMVQDGLAYNFILGEKKEVATGFPGVSGSNFSKYVSSTDDIFVTHTDTCFDGGFIYCGYSNGPLGSSADKVMYVIKTGINNQSGCGDLDASCIQYKYDFSAGFAHVNENLIESNALHIYPNPTHGDFNIQLPSNAKQLTVLDVYGKVIINKPISEISHKLKLNLNIAEGIYFVNVTNTYGKLTTKKLQIIK